ncbi:hypothetical protein [Bacillus sp. B-jedd]|uniref:hypothetical protein n=1 Tax=Bacillus sp. B-jedd TaxID=1476857 RepID=UPI000515544A|nr:hypothetical protein [Bacillus sp. B-jedd]CEG28676.1 hypothetical protein BN1002_03599 [Bacillus sp. B-jedd]
MIRELEKAEVSSVIFMRDYLQFFFEGEQGSGMLTAYVMPQLIVTGKSFDSTVPGYRDSLCSFISRRVKRSEMVEWNIRLIFDNDDRLEIPLQEADAKGMEAAMLRFDNEILIW